MKTKISVILLLLTGILCAQHNYMALSFGVGTPTGDFAAITSLESSGYATPGFMADYSGAYYPIDYLGIGGAIKFNQNGVNYQEVKDALSDLLPDDPDVSVEDPVFDIGLWRIVAFEVGPQLTLPTGKVCFDGYFFPGLFVVMPPQMQINAIIDGEPTKRYAESQNLRFGFEAGLAIRYEINSTSSLRLFASYLQTSSEGELLNELSDGTEYSEINFNRKVQIVNVGLGLVYRL